jgi:hypothetical protein
MKKLVCLFILIVLNVFRTHAQNDHQSPAYKVPADYRFDYKVVYDVHDQNGKPEQTVIYYFPNNGEYMSIVTPETKSKSEDFIILTREGEMVSFSQEPDPNNPGKQRNILKIIDMKSMYKGIGEMAAGFAKETPKKEKTGEEKNSIANLENFVRTGKTKNVFGYTAEEYSKHVSGMENGKERSGTVSVWYARVDFDPEVMFSMGLGGLANGMSQAKMQNSHSYNILGMGIAQKNYLLTELNFVEDNGKSGGTMKVTGIDKTDLTKETTGYYIENYSGMSLSEMIKQEMSKGK